jgi:hypothetical protein
MREYHVYHDCGKPYCLTIDDDGKQHFPNHAYISSITYAKYFSNKIVQKLILHDMNFHIMKSPELDKWLEENKEDKSFLASLYLTAWAEIKSNCIMFGGTESIGYKIKEKKLIQVGKKLAKLFDNRYTVVEAAIK